MNERIRRLLAQTEDPYAGAELPRARSMGAGLGVAGLCLTLLLLPLSPPDKAIGDAGWAVVGGLALVTLCLGYGLLMPRFGWAWEHLLAASYFTVFSLALIQWLAGGAGAPYVMVMALSILYVAVIHPIGRLATFLVLSGVLMALPLLYDDPSLNVVANTLVTYLLWCILAAAAYVVMSGVRAQRLTLSQEGAEAREEARLDPLTGIGNRRAFDEAIAIEIERAKRLDLPLSMMLLDIAGFKAINDRFGHVEGDNTLRDVSTALQLELRRPDLCFRWGGDEFAVVLAGTDYEGAMVAGERLRATVAASCEQPDGAPVTVRAGAAELRAGMDPLELTEAAGIGLLADRSAAER